MLHSTAFTMWNGRGGYFLLGMGIRLLRLGRRLGMLGGMGSGDIIIRRGGDSIFGSIPLVPSVFSAEGVEGMGLCGNEGDGDDDCGTLGR